MGVTSHHIPRSCPQSRGEGYTGYTHQEAGISRSTLGFFYLPRAKWLPMPRPPIHTPLQARLGTPWKKEYRPCPITGTLSNTKGPSVHAHCKLLWVIPGLLDVRCGINMHWTLTFHFESTNISERRNLFILWQISWLPSFSSTTLSLVPLWSFSS